MPELAAHQATTDSASQTIQFGGETMLLLPDKAVLWPAMKILLVADTHFGKGGVFRTAGVAIPTGTTANDLQRLSRLIAHHQPEQLIVLGDFLHGKPDEQVIRQIADWRQTLNCSVLVVRGNHDRHLKIVPDEWHNIDFLANLVIGQNNPINK